MQHNVNPSGPPLAPFRPLRILVAEDNDVNQRLTRRLLQNLGHTADIAANGLDVLAAVERVQYDVVLMDCHMPEMDGYEASRRIRQLEITSTPAVRRHRIRIIAFTASVFDGDREKCLAAGMDDYLSKPVQVEELKAALDRAQRDLR